MKLQSNIETRIYWVRGQRIIFDIDLAEIYGIPTKALNQAIKRNKERFPSDFMFRLNDTEFKNWRSQFVTANPSLKMGLRQPPYAFTEHGALMAANVLHSSRAIQMSLFIVRAFVRMRTFMTDRRELTKHLLSLEQNLIKRLDVHELAIVDILRRVMELLEPSQPESTPPPKRIGFQSKQ